MEAIRLSQRLLDQVKNYYMSVFIEPAYVIGKKVSILKFNSRTEIFK